MSSLSVLAATAVSAVPVDVSAVQDWTVVLGEFDDTAEDGWEQTVQVRELVKDQQVTSSWPARGRLPEPSV